MNQPTDPLLIELARAAYECPVARAALHDYWEDRGEQIMLLGFVEEKSNAWFRLVLDQIDDRIDRKFGLPPYSRCTVPVDTYEEMIFEGTITYDQRVLDYILSSFYLPTPFLIQPPTS